MPEAQEGTSFWGHVAELGKRMKVVLFTFIVTVVVMLILPGNTDFFATTSDYAPLMSVFLRDIRGLVLPPDVKLFTTTFSDAITLYVYAAVVFAVAITLPVFAYQAYKFVDPALYPHERKAIFPFVSVVTLLFVVGAVFGFFFLFPQFVTSMLAFFNPVGAEPWVPIMDFYGMLFFTIIVSGLIFTIPAFFVLLVKFGILRTHMFSKKRKYIYVGMIIAALFISLAALFEVSMFIGRRFERNAGPANVPAVLQAFSSPNSTCKYCHAQFSGNPKFCPNCNKQIG